ncbi:MAG: HAD family hydrolase [Planctomycetota bacterium]|jgi:putative hydrolase of the HAD superfamily
MGSTQRIDTILFDAGNTLFDLRETGPSPEWVRGKIYAEIVHRYACKVTPEEMTDFMTETVHEMPQRINGAFRYSVRWFCIFIERLFERLGRVNNVRGATQDLFTYFRDTTNFIVFKDVLPALRELKRRRYRMAIVSNWSPTLPMVLYGLGLGSFFSYMSVSAVVEMEKPAENIFHDALYAIGSAPKRAIHVGDSYAADYIGARNAGIEPLLVDRAGNHPRASEAENNCIRSLNEIIGIIENGRT